MTAALTEDYEQNEETPVRMEINPQTKNTQDSAILVKPSMRTIGTITEERFFTQTRMTKRSISKSYIRTIIAFPANLHKIVQISCAIIHAFGIRK